MTVDQGPDMERYQGVTPINGETLALCAETYFAQSEQTPTRVRLAVGHVDSGAGRQWRAGGILIQNIAEDDARGSTAKAWTTAQAHFETIGEDELIDPTLSAQTLLWRLFHEDGVRVFEATPLTGFCRCSQDRIVAVLAAFPPDGSAPPWSNPTGRSGSRANTARGSTILSRRRLDRLSARPCAPSVGFAATSPVKNGGGGSTPSSPPPADGFAGRWPGGEAD